ncbi:MAG: diacylglycerol/lipid kinase family protein [Candidatus Krumholzibacteriia bacterium]
MPRTTFVIINPAAGRRRGRGRIDRYLALLRRHVPAFDHAETRHAGHEIEVANDALSRGYANVIAVGGDGTWSAVADCIVKSGRRDVTLGMLPAGTGNDFGKSLGVTCERAEDVVRGIAAGCRRTVDVGRVEGRHFLNVVGLGFDIAVIDDAADFPLLKGDVLYQVCALRQLFRFRGIPLAISDAGSASARRAHLMLVIANANYFGGSFHIAPRASLEDGKLDAVSIYDAGPLARARLFSRVARGRHEGEKRVRIRQAGSFRIECGHPVRYEVDGEVCTSNGDSIEVQSVAQALDVFVPYRAGR